MSINVDWAQDLIAQKADRTELSELMSNARSNAAQVQVMVDIFILFSWTQLLQSILYGKGAT